MINQQVLQSHPFFYGIFAVIAMLALLLVFSFLGTIAFSLVMVIILKPVYDFILRRVKKAGIATLLTTTIDGYETYYLRGDESVEPNEEIPSASV